MSSSLPPSQDPSWRRRDWPRPGAACPIELRRVEGASAGQPVFIPGERIIGRAQLWGRAAHTDPVADGPVVAYLVPRDVALLAGKPIPSSAIGLGPFAVRHTRGHTWTATVGFTVPAVVSGGYTIIPCNDPCTIVGFDQYAQGWLDIVQTNEARKLLLKTYRQDENINALRRDYHEAVNDSESTKIALEAALSRSVDALKFAGAERLRAEAAENDAAAAQANARAATVRAAWLAVLASLCLMAAIILGVVRRRAARVYVPDSPAELVELSER